MHQPNIHFAYNFGSFRLPHPSRKRKLYMKILSRIIAVIIFVAFFGFALKNTDEVTLHFFGYDIRQPLALMLLAFFAMGAALGVLAMTPTVFRHRRELSRHKKTVVSLQKESEAQQIARKTPPQPDSVDNR
jgi:putative membrane protein